MKLSLEDLPEHQFFRMRVRGTLVTLNTRSGNDESFGSHTWHVMDDHAGLLLHTNFANPPFAGQPAAEATQSFPDEYPLARHVAGTGAARKAAHGFPQVSDTGVHDSYSASLPLANWTISFEMRTLHQS